MKPPKYGNNYGLQLEENRLIAAIDRGYTAIEDVSEYIATGPLKVPIFDLMVHKIWQHEGILGQ